MRISISRIDWTLQYMATMARARQRNHVLWVMAGTMAHMAGRKACLSIALTQPVHGIHRRDVMREATIVSSGLVALAPKSCRATGMSPSPATTQSSFVTLEPSGLAFPLVSFGLQVYDDEAAYKLTLTALQVGYRNFFASVLAGNQKGFARAVRDSGIPRSELFICGSVVSDRARGYEPSKQLTTRGWQDNLKAFAEGSITYLDQIMLDYPGPDCDSIRGQWRSFEDMEEQQYTRTLAVSNFSPLQLDCILSDPTTRIKPVVNQLPCSVAYHAPTVLADNRARGVLVQAWAPLGGSLGGRFDSRIKSACSSIGAKYNKSYAQVALRWIIQNGAAVCTQTKRKDHFIEDLALFDFNLSDEDMATLNVLA
jgi:diketogulonate reductase-like aldo/keto reductase